MKKISLNGEWNGCYAAKNGDIIDFRGTVPGCAHTDLLKAGMLPDYMTGYNVSECKFIEECSFEYKKDFILGEIHNVTLLQFSSLDVYCDVYLNDEKLGYCDDMFVPYVFDITKKIRKGSNQIHVKFYPPVEVVKDFPQYNGAFTGERMNIRRIQCTFGWDWVDRFVTQGIVGDVDILIPSKTEIDNVYAYTTHIDELGAQISVDTEFSYISDDTYLKLTVCDNEDKAIWSKKQLVVENRISHNITISDPKLWYPAGYGEQPLYKIYAQVYNDEEIISEKIFSFGIRTVRILEIKDKAGSLEYEKSLKLKKAPHLLENDFNDEFYSFILAVNGVKIFCKGGNWVPCEPFISDAQDIKYIELLRLAKEANFNMIRVWGGGVFEKDVFYDECDRLGIMVTQDFLMACGEYPQNEEWFLDKLRLETKFAAKKLRNHPSLVWWTGDNENAAYANLDMKEFNGRKAALLAIEPVLKNLDPHRLFVMSCPFGGKPFKSATSGTTHNTFFIDSLYSYVKEQDLKNYNQVFNQYLSRFCTEAPLMGAPAYSSLRRFLTEDQIFNDDDCMRFHTKNNPMEMFKEFTIFDAQVTLARKLLGEFKNEQDRLFKLQYVQYEWVRITMELYRRNKWYSSGLIFWMFNDCWPANGWSLIDYYCNPKSGYYAMKRSGEPVSVSIVNEDKTYKVYILNDSLQAVSGKACLYIQCMDKKEHIWEQEIDFNVDRNISDCIFSIPEDKINSVLSPNSILLCDISGNFKSCRAFNFPYRIADLSLPGEGVKVVKKTANSITVYAEKYVHAVGLDGDYCFDDNFFSLNPDESRTIHFKATLKALSDEIKIYCL